MMMRTFIAVASLVVASSVPASDRDQFETSLIVEFESVEPLLLQLRAELGLDLPVSEMVVMGRATPIGRGYSIKWIKTKFGGSSVDLRYLIRRDGVDAAALKFISEDEVLIGAIGDQLSRFADRRGQ